jgi:hypothetical protein
MMRQAVLKAVLDREAAEGGTVALAQCMEKEIVEATVAAASERVIAAGRGRTMTDINRMQAGREMDALVAEKVMGCNHVIRHLTGWVCADDHQAVPKYSVDIAAAWEVVGKLQKQGMAMSLVFGVYTWECKFGDASDVFGQAKHSDVPLAICRAALKAVEGQ